MSGWDKHPRYGGDSRIPWLFIAVVCVLLVGFVALLSL